MKRAHRKGTRDMLDMASKGGSISHERVSAAASLRPKSIKSEPFSYAWYTECSNAYIKAVKRNLR